MTEPAYWRCWRAASSGRRVEAADRYLEDRDVKQNHGLARGAAAGGRWGALKSVCPRPRL